MVLENGVDLCGFILHLSSGCCYKVPWAEWLMNAFISTVWEAEEVGSGASRPGSGGRQFPGLCVMLSCHVSHSRRWEGCQATNPTHKVPAFKIYSPTPHLPIISL